VDVQLIPCKLIDRPKVDRNKRSFSKEFAGQLAASIKAEGMYNPILVIPSSETTGRFTLVQGRHRLYAKQNVLKEEAIEASVATDMDETDVKMATVAENLWRNPLTKAQHLLAIKEWFEYYQLKHPEKVGQGVAGGKARQKKAAAGATATTATDPAVATTEGADEASLNLRVAGQADTQAATEAAEGAAGAGVGVGNFAETVAAATGQSLGAARRAASLARTFDPDQLEVFDQMKVSQTDMLTIQKVKEEDKRGQIVSLIASGMEAADAIKEVMGDQAPSRQDGKSVAEREAESVTKKETEPELSDDEWFSKYCGDKAKLLGDSTRYKADALLFRRISEPRHTFRTRAKKTVASVKAALSTGTGPFLNLVNRFISVSHPKDWQLCDICTGKGKPPRSSSPCTKCYGGGYLLSVERFL
jgi:ParB-like chromosome segregation protein Spo0J